MERYPEYIVHQFFFLGRERVTKLTTATLISGTVRLDVDLDDLEDGCNTLDDILDLFREAAGIAEGATVAVNGDTDVPGDYEVQPQDEISVTKTTGSKG